MRIISQDGVYDTPCETTQLWVQTDSYLIRGNMPADEAITLAIYSSEEKALKAMKMLREHHEKVAFLKTIINTEKGTSFASRLSITEFDEMTRNYFQFPKDDEVEV
jgi:hypothetical protein|nr:MAG TPA: hypothetical protein [Bacteriophage sp.]